MDKPHPLTATQNKPRFRAIFISPHLDDAVFSCGGEIARLVDEGAVLVINIFSRYLSEVKLRGVVLGDERYQEEADAARFLKYESRNLGELDVSFRREAYKKLGNIFRPPVTEDEYWLPQLRQKLFAVLAELDYEQLYVPLGVGWHVDHVLTFQVFEPWIGRPNLFFYEDAPYCCIPHSTRYRLRELAIYAHEATDASLAPINEIQAWWQAAMAYAKTALMKNLRPWFVRVFAVPVVSVYLFRLMALHRRHLAAPPLRHLQSFRRPIGKQLERKIEAMQCYRSQFREFFTSQADCLQTITQYANRQQAGNHEPVERFWQFLDPA